MIRFSLILCVVFVFCAIGSTADASDDKHPLDTAMDKALDLPDNQSTAGTIRVYNEFAIKWKNELQRGLTELGKKLSGKELADFSAGQRRWEAWCEIEKRSIELIYGKLEGTMYRPMQVYAVMNLTRMRALQLLRYLNMLGHAE